MEKGRLDAEGNLLVFLARCSRKYRFSSRYDGDRPTRVPSGKFSVHSIMVGLRSLQSLPGRDSHLDLRPDPQGSSPAPEHGSRGSWRFHRDSDLFVWRHTDSLSLELEKAVSSFRVATWGSVGFISRCHRAVNLPSCSESILMVTVESLPGRPGYLGVHGDIGVFEMVARPLEFLSRVS